MTTYFVGRRQFSSDPFRIVYKEVKTRTRKGNPLTFELKSLEAEYQTWEEAWNVATEMNARSQGGSGEAGSSQDGSGKHGIPCSGVCPPWPL